MNYHASQNLFPIQSWLMSRDLMSHSHSFPKIALHPLPPQICSRTSCSQELLVRSVEGVKFPCLLFSYLTSIVVVLAFSINAILEYESISCLTTESIHDMCQSNKVNCIKSGGLVRFELLYCWDFCIFYAYHWCLISSIGAYCQQRSDQYLSIFFDIIHWSDLSVCLVDDFFGVLAWRSTVIMSHLDLN